jgi:competence protein ComFC
MITSCFVCSGKRQLSFSWQHTFKSLVSGSDPYLLNEDWLCTTCAQQLEQLKEGCISCNRMKCQDVHIAAQDEHGAWQCYDCYRWKEWEKEQKLATLLEANISAIAYNEWTQEQIARFKYRKDERFAWFFASLIIKRCQEAFPMMADPKIDLVIPVPLSTERLHERGFNQAAKLAQLVASYYQLPFVERVILRRNDDQKQSKKGREARMEDLLRKFIKDPQQMVDISNKSVLLIDDIYTTGATVYAACAILKQLGAKRIISLTLAR